MNTTHGGGNQPPSGLRGDPGVDRTSSGEARDKASAASSADPIPAETDPEKWLREEWWANHGCSFGSLYGDDGEMQCNASTCMIDFKRTPITTLKTMVEARRVAVMMTGLKSAAADPALRTLSQQWQADAKFEGYRFVALDKKRQTGLAGVAEGRRQAKLECAADLDRVCPLIEKGQKVDLETRNQQTLQNFLERAELAEAEVVRLKAMVEALDARLLDAETNRS